MYKNFNILTTALAVPGIILQVTGAMLFVLGRTFFLEATGGLAVMAGTVLVVGGLAYLASAKGQRPIWCLLGLLSFAGWIALALMEDLVPNDAAPGQNVFRTEEEYRQSLEPPLPVVAERQVEQPLPVASVKKYYLFSLLLGVPGLTLQVIGQTAVFHGSVEEGLLTYLAGTPLLIGGLALHALAKGLHQAWCLLGLFSWAGWILLGCLPNLEAQKKLSPDQVFQGVDNLSVFLLVARIAASLFLSLVLAGMVLILFQLGGFELLVFLACVFGWMLFAFFHYRHVRQTEVANLLAAAAEARQPLSPILWAYLIDRPRGALRNMAAAIFLSILYWGGFGRNSFDKKVQRVALMLETGMPLHKALSTEPGVASRETILAAAAGQSTGKLAPCLRGVPRWRLAAVWLELWPRFLYPIVVLAILLALVSFLMTFVIPKFEKIFADFKLRLPPITELLIGWSRQAVKFGVLPFGFFLALGLGALLYFNSAVRWYCPVLGRWYQMHVQARTLTMLGLLLETGQTVPGALNVLIESGYFYGFLRRRLENVLQSVSGGAALAEELQREGFVPASMVPLLHSAEKASNLPWALAELGEHQMRRTLELAQRIIAVLFPLTIAVMGVVVGFVILSLFMPLIQLIDSMGTLGTKPR